MQQNDIFIFCAVCEKHYIYPVVFKEGRATKCIFSAPQFPREKQWHQSEVHVHSNFWWFPQINFSMAVKVGKEPKTTLHMFRHIPDRNGRKIYKQEKFIYKPFSLGYEVMASK